jgi:DNA-binding transcriptional regulator YiaG
VTHSSHERVPPEAVTKLGDGIRAVRERNGLTQPEFADVLDVSVTIVGRWERGESIPSIGLFVRLLSLFPEIAHSLAVGDGKRTIRRPRERATG